MLLYNLKSTSLESCIPTIIECDESAVWQITSMYKIFTQPKNIFSAFSGTD